MKKVLIISYYYPPRPGIASNRIGGLCKYLPEYEWKPTILTPKLPGEVWAPYAKVIETDYSPRTDKLKTLMGFKSEQAIMSQSKGIFRTVYSKFGPYIKEFIEYPDQHRGWIPIGIRKGLEIIKRDEFSAIITSSGPESTHIIGNRIHSISGIPWIADLRDLWTQNQSYQHSQLRSFFENRLEIVTLKNAHALVTVSKPLAEKLGKLHNRRVYPITNGFDPDEIREEHVDSKIPDKKLIITYTGQIYNAKQDPTLLLKVISQLINQRKLDRESVQVRFYGPFNSFLNNIVGEMGLEGVVVQYGVIDRNTSIERQQESSCLLLLNWNDPSVQGIYTGKLFEYLAARRPILSIGGSGGVVKELLDETHAGIHISEEEDLKDLILLWAKEIDIYGSIIYNTKPENINKYSYIAMAEKFASLLDSCDM